MPEVFEEAMVVNVDSDGFPLLGWSVAEDIWNDKEAQQVWSSGESASRDGVRVASSVRFSHGYTVRLLELKSVDGGMEGRS